jgi:hypothetical protein
MVRDQGVGGSNPLSPTNLSLTVSITYTAFAAFDFAPELLGEVCRRMSGVRYVFVGDAELEWSIEVDRGMPPVSRNRQLSAEVKAAIKIAASQRVEAVWTCLGVLCPDLTTQAKKELAQKVLDLSRGEDRKAPRTMITPAQVSSIIWPHMQCINPRCPMRSPSPLSGWLRPGMPKAGPGRPNLPWLGWSDFFCLKQPLL